VIFVQALLNPQPDEFAHYPHVKIFAPGLGAPKAAVGPINSDCFDQFDLVFCDR
jgi:hypothetical protein